MQLIASDILAEGNGLSVPFSAAGVVLGLLLWAYGWRWHRFWVVFAATVGAGIYGLHIQSAGAGPRMLAVAVLLAVAVGMMAIDLSRLIAFATAGLGCWLIVRAVVPAFQEPMICILAGGVLGLCLYRLQMMLIFSFSGVLLFGHCALWLFEKLMEAEFNAEKWAANNSLALNIAVIATSLLGVAIQGQFDRYRQNSGQRRREQALQTLSPQERDHLRGMPQRSWLDVITGRRAA
jgi:hypothetical protein